jgi:hypothetical protein
LNDITPYQTKRSPVTNAQQLVPVESYAATTKQSAKETWTIKERIVYGLLGLVGVGGTVWLGRKIILNARANKEQNNSFEDGSWATIAKQIKMAFDNDGWWGTNTEALREALISVQSQEDWNKIIRSYQKLYNTNLLKDMSDELQSTEYNEMLQIINAKPKKRGQAPTANQYRAWAKRLKAAFDKEYGFLPGTDDAAIKATFHEIPTQAAFVKVGVEYKRQFGNNLLDDLKAESEFGQYDEWMLIIVQKRKS